MLSSSRGAFEHYLYKGPWLCVLTPEALASLSSSVVGNKRALSQWPHETPEPRDPSAHFQLAGKALILTRTGPPGRRRVNLKTRPALSPPAPESSALPLAINTSVLASQPRRALAGSPEERLKDAAICFGREIDETAATLGLLAAVRTCRVDGPGQAPVLSRTEQGDR